MRTRIRHRVLLALGLFCAIAPMFAVDTTKFKPTGYVNDFAGAFDQQNKLQAESLLRRLDRAAGVQVSLVTILTLEGEPIEDVANRLYREWGIGKKDTNEGALVLLAVNDRKYRVEVGYGLEPILPDGYVGGVMRDVGPALKQGHYGAALLTVAQNFAQRIAERKNVSLEGLPDRKRPARSRGGGLPIGLIVLAVIVLFALFSGGSRGGGGLGTMSRRRYGGGPVILPFPMGGGGGGWGGGGFGGGGSVGGGFGGFGGGDSGGGGASGSW